MGTKSRDFLMSLKAEGIKSSNKEDNVNGLPNYVMVAGIYIGLTSSGYAFSFKNKPDIYMNNKFNNWGDWDGWLGLHEYTTPTCLLCDNEGKFIDFGYGAQNKNSDLIEQGDNQQYFFEDFMYKLHSENNLNENTEIAAANGKKMKALDVLGMALKYIKNHFFESLEKHMDETLTNMVRWIVTVPSILPDASKQWMRNAALNAGMIDALDSLSLTIAFESEAASMFVSNLEPSELISENKVEKMSVGTKCLLVNVGDIACHVTAYKCLQRNIPKEFIFSSTDSVSYLKVREQFTILMKNIFSSDFIDFLQKKLPNDWHQFMFYFDKRIISVNEYRSLVIPLTYFIAEIYRLKKGQDIKKAITDCRIPGVQYQGGSLMLKPDVLNELFSPCIQNLTSYISSLLLSPKLRGLKYIFLFGVFFETPIADCFENIAVVRVQHKFSFAALQGAVLMGHDSHKHFDMRTQIREILKYQTADAGNEDCTSFGDRTEKAKIADEKQPQDNYTKPKTYHVEKAHKTGNLNQQKTTKADEELYKFNNIAVKKNKSADDHDKRTIYNDTKPKTLFVIADKDTNEVNNFINLTEALVPEGKSNPLDEEATLVGQEPKALRNQIPKQKQSKPLISFVPDLHNEGNLFHLDIYVNKADGVPAGYRQTSTFSPVQDEHDAAKVSLYSIVAGNEAEHHGDIKVKWAGKGKDRQLEVTLVFGDAQLEVFAVTQPGGKKAHMNVDL